MDESLQIITLQLGEDLFGVEVLAVSEVIMPPTINHLPNLPSFVEGVINLRRNVIPVIDLRKRFGYPCPQSSGEERIIVFEMSGQFVGMLVDRVYKVERISRAEIVDPPEYVHRVGQRYIRGMYQVEDKVVTILDPEKIFSETEQEKLQHSLGPYSSSGME